MNERQQQTVQQQQHSIESLCSTFNDIQLILQMDNNSKCIG